MIPDSVNEELIALRQRVNQLEAELATCGSYIDNFRQIFEAISDGILIYDLETEQVIDVNPAMYNLIGYTREEFLASHPSAYIHPDTLPLLADFLATLRAGKEFYCQGVDIHKDGKQFIDIEVKGTLCQYNGKTHGLAIIRDITVRKATEAQLREYGERQALLNQLSNQIRNSLDVNTIIKTTIEELYKLLQVDWCAFSWFDPTVTPSMWHVVQDVHWQGETSVGSYSAEIIGAIDKQLLNLETIRIDNVDFYEEPTHRAFLQQIKTKSRITVPIKTQLSKLGIIICDHQKQTHVWSDNEIELLEAVAVQLGIAIDQAELYAESQQKSEKLKKTLEQLKLTQTKIVQSEKMSSLGQMVAGIAHEINNPVGFIHSNLTHAETYVKDILQLLHLYQTNYPNPVPAIQAEIKELDLDFSIGDLSKLFSSMKTGTERIREIVLSLRTFSRLDEAELKTVNIHDNISSALVLLGHRFKETNTRPAININKHYNDLPKIDCFAGYFNQALMNILNNAVDALEDSCKRQQANPTIEIETKQINNNQIAIIIRDNGIGINESVKPLIFDPFFTTKPVGKGTGMGLASSYQIITEKHGGNLTCNSTLGKGTEFSIIIPVRQQGIDI
jgi:two-component system, NtrC family, sensor kinase